MKIDEVLEPGPTEAKPGFPSIKLMIFDVPSLFTSSRCFVALLVGFLPSIPASNSSTMPWKWSQGKSTVVVWSGWILSLFYFWYVWCTTRKKFTQTMIPLTCLHKTKIWVRQVEKKQKKKKHTVDTTGWRTARWDCANIKVLRKPWMVDVHCHGY